MCIADFVIAPRIITRVTADNPKIYFRARMRYLR
jgi:hypothetical protein